MTIGRRVFGLLLVLCCGTWLISVPASAGLLSGLANSRVDISTGFAGRHVFVYGSMPQAGDIVIRVTSPDEQAALSRDKKAGPFWINGRKLIVKDVPGLMYLLSNRPLKEIAAHSVLSRNGLTFRSTLAKAQISGGPEFKSHPWKPPFDTLKRSQGLFRKQQTVHITGGQLFSASFPLPAELPIGPYRLEVFYFHNGKLIAHESHTLQVTEVGIEHWLSSIAATDPWAFGVSFTLLAMALGLGLSMLLRRDHGRRP